MHVEKSINANGFFFRLDWASIKIMLGDSNFLKKLVEYDKDNIPEAKLKKIRRYTADVKFHPDVVAKVSKVWVFLSIKSKTTCYLCQLRMKRCSKGG